MAPEDCLPAIETIPALPGSYALHLRLPATCSIRVGKFGIVDFPSGDYLYLGSALGPGGLRARLGRHLMGNGKPRWHIDALRAASLAIGAWWAAFPPQVLSTLLAERLECRWSLALAEMEGAFLPVPGFGASDCSSGCPAHLVAFPTEMVALKERLECVLSGCCSLPGTPGAPIVYVDAGTIGESCSQEGTFNAFSSI